MAAALVLSRSSQTERGGCTDAVGDTYEFRDNGVFVPGSAGELRRPEDYTTWTIPVTPPTGTDIVAADLVRDEDWLTVSVELADEWVPATGPADSTADSAAGLGRMSKVAVFMDSDGWRGAVDVSDSPADTVFSVRPLDSPADVAAETQLDPPEFDGRTATVRIPTDSLDRLGDSFEVSFTSETVAADSEAVVVDDCPGPDQTIAFPGDSSSPSVSVSTTAAVEPPSSRLETTTAPAPTTPDVELPPDCPHSWTGPSQDLEMVARCAYEAYKAGDREWAQVFADPDAVASLFDTPWEPPEWEFLGCENQATTPPYGYCRFWIEGEPHGVQVEMAMDGGVSAGITVFSVEYFG